MQVDDKGGVSFSNSSGAVRMPVTAALKHPFLREVAFFHSHLKLLSYNYNNSYIKSARGRQVKLVQDLRISEELQKPSHILWPLMHQAFLEI